MPDRWERVHRVHGARADPDRDGLPNRFEYRARTDPRRRDSDRDRIRDGREDPDRDHLDNAGELAAGTHPRKPDTDGDGVLDGDEADEDLLDAAGDELPQLDAETQDAIDEAWVMDGEDDPAGDETAPDADDDADDDES
jgi:hypothetical protein